MVPANKLNKMYLDNTDEFFDLEDIVGILR